MLVENKIYPEAKYTSDEWNIFIKQKLECRTGEENAHTVEHT